MFKPLALFAPLYFVDLLALHIVAPASVATQFHWCYPLVAAVAVMLTGMVVRPPRPLAQLRDNLSAADVALMLAHVAAVFLALYFSARWSTRR